MSDRTNKRATAPHRVQRQFTLRPSGQIGRRKGLYSIRGVTAMNGTALARLKMGRLFVSFWMLGLLSVSGVGTAAASGGAAPANSYCANRGAIFTDRDPFMGISDPSVDSDTPALRDCTFGQMAASHIGYFREWLSWPAVEVAPNQYDFTLYDGIVAGLARHHLTMLPMLLGTPAWRGKRAPGVIYPPDDPQAFASFATLCVKRYGPHGSFWRANPTLPYYPVRAWEIWNEPNLAQYWEPRPDLRAYIRLLRASSLAIKRADSHATIVMAGMPFSSAAATMSFYTQLYRDGVRGAFDALGFHGYSASLGGALARLQAVRSVMNRFGDSKKDIWLTEWGWAGGQANVFTPNASGQRAIIASFLSLVQRYRAQLRLKEVMYFDWADRVDDSKPSDWYVFHLGLFTDQLQPKPALAVFSAAGRQLDAGS